MPSISEVAICNQGLGWLGASLITSLDDTSKEAKLCQANYDYLRDVVLESADWSFALKRVQLSQAGDDDKVIGYGQAYQVPADCLRVIQASPNTNFDTTDPILWEYEDRKVLTDEGTIYIKYVARIIDPVRYSPGFVNALAYRIASELAIPITRNRALQEQMFTLYEMRKDEAMGMDGKQGRTRRIQSTWSDRSRKGVTY